MVACKKKKCPGHPFTGWSKGSLAGARSLTANWPVRCDWQAVRARRAAPWPRARWGAAYRGTVLSEPAGASCYASPLPRYSGGCSKAKARGWSQDVWTSSDTGGSRGPGEHTRKHSHRAAAQLSRRVAGYVIDGRTAVSVAIVQVENLTKKYGAVEALRGVSFEVHAGEVFGLLGPNGAGKTTTIEILEGLRTPDSGRVSVCGLDPQRSGTSYKQQIGAVLQSTAP